MIYRANSKRREPLNLVFAFGCSLLFLQRYWQWGLRSVGSTFKVCETALHPSYDTQQAAAREVQFSVAP
jgi:hypothetical protein